MTIVTLLAFFLGCGSTTKDAESAPTDDTELTDDTASADDTQSTPDCGNGVIDDGEQCDGGDMAGFDCAALGYSGGALGCDPVACTYDTSGCTL